MGIRENNIQKNDYVQPTEVRMEIVNNICDAILGPINKNNFGSIRVEIRDFFESPAAVYLRRDESKGRYSPYSILGKETSYWSPSCYKENTFIKVRGCEMRYVFNVIQDAGYHIFHISEDLPNCKSVFHHYVFTKKPICLGRRAERIKFDLFID